MTASTGHVLELSSRLEHFTGVHGMVFHMANVILMSFRPRPLPLLPNLRSRLPRRLNKSAPANVAVA